jgi:hypothetical protein
VAVNPLLRPVASWSESNPRWVMAAPADRQPGHGTPMVRAGGGERGWAGRCDRPERSRAGSSRSARGQQLRRCAATLAKAAGLRSTRTAAPGRPREGRGMDQPLACDDQTNPTAVASARGAHRIGHVLAMPERARRSPRLRACSGQATRMMVTERARHSRGLRGMLGSGHAHDGDRTNPTQAGAAGVLGSGTGMMTTERTRRRPRGRVWSLAGAVAPARARPDAERCNRVGAAAGARPWSLATRRSERSRVCRWRDAPKYASLGQRPALR